MNKMNGAERIAYKIGRDVLIDAYNKRIRVLLQVVHKIANYRFRDMSLYELLCYENLIHCKRMLRRLSHEKNKKCRKNYKNASLHR